MQGKCAYLSQCTGCGRSHTKASVVFLDAATSVITPFERMQLENGRATLAALLAKRVELHGDRRKPLSYLRQIERMGLLGTKTRAPTADLLRDRQAARDAALPSPVERARLPPLASSVGHGVRSGVFRDEHP